jgi:hypothetical protein
MHTYVKSYINTVIPNRGTAAHWGAVKKSQLLDVIRFLVKHEVICR